jgi:hypothetical protein
LGLLPELVQGVLGIGQLWKKGRGGPLHDNADLHALGGHVQAIEQDMDKTDRITVENEQRSFFHPFSTLLRNTVKLYVRICMVNLKLGLRSMIYADSRFSPQAYCEYAEDWKCESNKDSGLDPFFITSILPN